MADKTVRGTIVAGVVAGLVLLGLWYAWWGRPPQIGGDEEAVKVVDALFTACTSRNTTRLAQCEEQLHALRDAGKLPRPAADHLDAVIHVARTGKWREAAERLFVFMKAQRRPNA
jgi:hypothetical protein